jgi:HEAT repeat protein
MKKPRSNPPGLRILASNSPGMSDSRDPELLLGEAVKGMATRAMTAEDPLTRKHAIYMLGMTNNPDYMEIFIRALRDPEKAVRAQATLALVAIGRPALDPLIHLLDDPDWKVRYRAAEALGLLKEQGAIGPLIRRLSDEKDHVRYMAAKSLGMLKDPAAIEPLQRCLADENPYVRRMAETAVEIIGGTGKRAL